MNMGRRSAIVAPDNNVGGGQALLNSYQRTRKQKKKDYLIDEQDEPEDREGLLVQHPDMLK